MQATDEQQVIRDAFATGDDMVVEARAGTGKTSTLRMLAGDSDDRGLYIAFNRAVADEAKATFDSSTSCRTAHSIAFGAVGRNYAHRLNGPRVTSRQTVEALGLSKFKRSGVELASWQMGYQVMDTVRRFCYSDDERITQRHVPWVNSVGDEWREDFANLVAEFARGAWEDLTKIDGKLRFTHDVYLKMWALDKPTLNHDFILFDEAQDASPVISGVVMRQDAQKILVGDAAQAIYAWRGARNSMGSFEAVHRLPLSLSFRFGQEIADEANRWLELLDEVVMLRGNKAVESTVEPLEDPQAILCRTNAECVMQAMEADRNDKKAAIVGGTAEIERFAKAVQQLQRGDTVSHPDLMGFGSWSDVCSYAHSSEGRDLTVMVKLIERFGVKKVLEVVARVVDEASADVIVSTAHKAKGLEWDSVKIASDFDFTQSSDRPLPNPSELNLAYVAITRAKEALDRGGLEWIDRLKTTLDKDEWDLDSITQSRRSPKLQP